MYGLNASNGSIKIMKTVVTLLSVIAVTNSGPVGNNVRSQSRNQTRRILVGGSSPVGDTRPYMVYLRPARQAFPQVTETDWQCGGVIIHERFILTSAACIEDAKNFYVVSGTHQYVPLSDTTNECVKNSAKKAVWKCVPKDYFYDGDDFDNIRWMANDIAVVKVEDNFNFEKRIRGCEYVPQMIEFNNKSVDNERPGLHGSIAGWGSFESFGDIVMDRKTENSVDLMETDVVLISKSNCKKRWSPRYHHIIDDGMICTKDDQDFDSMSSVCLDQGIDCKEMAYSNEYDDTQDTNEQKETTTAKTYRRMLVPDHLEVHHSSQHLLLNGTRRGGTRIGSGGFCENDHGGPLVVGHGKTAMVVGVICACMTKDVSKKCYGPFLYTSVWHHRTLISCAIDKDIMGATCKKLLRMSRTQIQESTLDWADHPDGPAKDDPEAKKSIKKFK